MVHGFGARIGVDWNPEDKEQSDRLERKGEERKNLRKGKEDSVPHKKRMKGEKKCGGKIMSRWSVVPLRKHSADRAAASSALSIEARLETHCHIVISSLSSSPWMNQRRLSFPPNCQRSTNIRFKSSDYSSQKGKRFTK